jgi:hypothetical protein
LQPKIKGLHVPSIAPSQATSEYVKKNQSDPNYYTPCSNDFLLQSHLLAYEDIDVELKVSNDLCTEIQRIHSDINSAFHGEDHGVGYLGQKGLHEEGITALLTSNLQMCFMNYSIHRGNSMVKQVCIMHQSSIRDENNTNHAIDIMLCYRQDTHLLPLMFFEFTKTSTKTIDGKEPQAAIYANHLMRVLWGKYQHSPLALSSSTSSSSSTFSYTHALPQMGIIMSENEMLLKLYTKTTINKGSDSEDKIAEKNILRCELNAANLERLLYIMYGWVNYCIEQMNSSKDITLKLRSKKESNVIDLGEVIVKSYDYRSISGRKTKIERSPQFYDGRFQNFRYLARWHDAVEPSDSLVIVQYDKVKGTHMPTCVGHLKNLLRELQCLHNECIVHGDIRLSNVIFSIVSNQSDDEIKTTLIDFDFSGAHENKTYPSRFNLEIGDGSRHANARSGFCLKYEHDVHSVFWIIEKYQTIHGQQFDTTNKELADVIGDLSQLDEREVIVSKVTSEAMDTVESGSPML